MISADLPNRPAAAALSMLAAMVVIGCIDNFIALIARDVGLWQFQLVRAIIALPLIVAFAALYGGTVIPRRLWAVALRSALVAVAMVFYFGALAFMPIALALAGLFTSPIFVLLITVVVLRQSVGPRRVMAVAAGFAGLLLVLGPEVMSVSPLVLLPALGGLFYAMGAVVTRQFCEGESTLSMLAGLLCMQAIMGGLALIALAWLAPHSEGFVFRGWTWNMGEAMPWIVIQAVGSSLGVGLIIRAYQLGEASQVAVFEYSVFIFGPFFAWLIFGQSVTTLQIAGITLIAAAGIFIALRSS